MRQCYSGLRATRASLMGRLQEKDSSQVSDMQVIVVAVALSFLQVNGSIADASRQLN